MYKQTMGFIRGMGAGMVAGFTAAAVGNRMMKNNRSFRHNANKARRAVNGMFGNVQDVFRQ